MQMRAKLASRRRPAAEDFSAWNCTPKTLSDSSAAVNGTSYSHDAAVRALLEGDEARIDLGLLATGQRFAIGMGVGLDASMIAGAPGPMKRRLGFFAYVLSATRAVF